MTYMEFDVYGNFGLELPQEKKSVDSAESGKTELPEPPKEIVLEKNPVDLDEETTIKTDTTGNDGLILPNTNNN